MKTSTKKEKEEKMYKYILFALLILFLGFSLYKVVYENILLSYNHKYTVGVVESVSAAAEGDCNISYIYYVNGVKYQASGGIPCDGANDYIGKRCWIKYYVPDPDLIMYAIWDVPISDSIISTPIEKSNSRNNIK